MLGIHATFPRQAIALPQITGAAGGHDICPDRAPAARARHQVIKGQIVRGIRLAAILTGKPVAQKNIERVKAGWRAAGTYSFNETTLGSCISREGLRTRTS